MKSPTSSVLLLVILGNARFSNAFLVSEGIEKTRCHQLSAVLPSPEIAEYVGSKLGLVAEEWAVDQNAADDANNKDGAPAIRASTDEKLFETTSLTGATSPKGNPVDMAALVPRHDTASETYGAREQRDNDARGSRQQARQQRHTRSSSMGELDTTISGRNLRSTETVEVVTAAFNGALEPTVLQIKRRAKEEAQRRRDTTARLEAESRRMAWEESKRRAEEKALRRIKEGKHGKPLTETRMERKTNVSTETVAQLEAWVEAREKSGGTTEKLKLLEEQRIASEKAKRIAFIEAKQQAKFPQFNLGDEDNETKITGDALAEFVALQQQARKEAEMKIRSEERGPSTSPTIVVQARPSEIYSGSRLHEKASLPNKDDEEKKNKISWDNLAEFETLQQPGKEAEMKTLLAAPDTSPLPTAFAPARPFGKYTESRLPGDGPQPNEDDEETENMISWDTLAEFAAFQQSRKEAEMKIHSEERGPSTSPTIVVQARPSEMHSESIPSRKAPPPNGEKENKISWDTIAKFAARQKSPNDEDMKARLEARGPSTSPAIVVPTRPSEMHSESRLPGNAPLPIEDRAHMSGMAMLERPFFAQKPDDLYFLEFGEAAEVLRSIDNERQTRQRRAGRPQRGRMERLRKERDETWVSNDIQAAEQLSVIGNTFRQEDRDDPTLFFAKASGNVDQKYLLY